MEDGEDAVAPTYLSKITLLDVEEDSILFLTRPNVKFVFELKY